MDRSGRAECGWRLNQHVLDPGWLGAMAGCDELNDKLFGDWLEGEDYSGSGLVDESASRAAAYYARDAFLWMIPLRST